RARPHAVAAKEPEPLRSSVRDSAAKIRLICVPEISRFHGIIIRMFVERSERHHLAHFHAHYQDAVGVYAIDGIALVAGALPQPQHRLVVAWAKLHQLELQADWDALRAGQRPAKIEPLR